MILFQPEDSQNFVEFPIPINLSNKYTVDDRPIVIYMDIKVNMAFISMINSLFLYIYHCYITFINTYVSIQCESFFCVEELAYKWVSSTQQFASS